MNIELVLEENVIGVIEFGNVTIATVGTSDHAQLTNRDIADQHPISSITGLETALNSKEPLKGDDDNYVTDAQLIVIGNTSGVNTGDQDLSGLQPKEIGKGLSTNDYTDAEKVLVATIPNKAETSDIPTALSELSDDATHRIVTDTEKATWNAKANIADIPTNFDSLYYRENEIDTKLLTKSDTSHNHSLNSLTEKSYNSLTDKPTIPTDFNTLYYTKSEIDTKIGDIETLLEAI